jgi:pimeloyl-ACP methyl ester carboxylesterase
MATYLLVHGAWGGGDGWRDVAKRLKLAGHEVHIASMTGLGARKHLVSPAITLSTHIADVTGLIDMLGLKDIILVGHSYGGMVITGAAQERAALISALVYVDAFVPKDGEALWDIATDWERKHYIDAQRDMPGLVAPFPGAPAHLTRHPLLTLTEPVRFKTESAGIKRRTYIYATRGAPQTFGKFYDRAKTEKGWRAFELNTSHNVMADDPDGLTTLLLSEAR